MHSFPNNCVTKGYKNTIVQDLAKYKYDIFSNDEITLNIDSVLPFKSEMIEYDCESPSIIDNAIITISKENNLARIKYFCNVLNYLEQLVCKHIVIDVVYPVNSKDLIYLLENINKYNISYTKLLLRYDESYYSDYFASYVLGSCTIFSCIIYNSPFDKNFSNLIHFASKDKIISFDKIKDEFSPNIPLYIEAHCKNVYFNKKMFIGELGEIKNSPECVDVYGYINELKGIDELYGIVNNKQFRELWDSKKDLCHICKDCEFRYMCVDNRIPRKLEDDMWIYDKECNYNPYTGIWKDD